MMSDPGSDKDVARRKRCFSSVSLPTPLIEKIERVVDELGYWPSKTSFVREAAIEKLQKHREELAKDR